MEFSATLKPPLGARTPGGFDRAAYLARQGVYLETSASTVQDKGPGAPNPVRKAAVAARIKLEGVLNKTLPPREAALMAGLLFGSRSELSDDIKEAFKSSGVFQVIPKKSRETVISHLAFSKPLGERSHGYGCRRAGNPRRCGPDPGWRWQRSPRRRGRRTSGGDTDGDGYEDTSFLAVMTRAVNRYDEVCG